VRSAAVLVGLLVLVALAASFGASFQPGAWYADLHKPPLNPPSWIFAPVWGALYLGMAVAAWWVWRAGGGARPLALWSTQLLLNALWSWLFFGLHRPALALVDIAVLLVVLGATTIAFLRVHVPAGLLLVPYVAWVAFASYLNAGLWALNR
jgi:tryptophan-rich sensory protein